ncbi:hypothetical protein SAMN02745823_00389 [Sporobacter termitidis DSM 10068]|uniref:Uncharacterized protein n=1 Tax=Sporobacter termitidis DSM 10068 TaxID=1123282 RepID=A0A1M5U7C2_9FIRM|nr:hypothetical protein [Sporobacter termitidis]SHH58887.1 hypothetical protein SAMN02745823_00389 [Sporobacter termitidis DSM 10068]
MRKSAVVIPVFALIAGVIGFLLRRTEVNTAFDLTTGFAVRGAAVTTILIVVSIAVTVLAVAAGILISARLKAENDYAGAFAHGGFSYFAVSFALGIVWIAANVLYFFNVYAMDALSILDLIFVFLGVVAAISLMFLARGAYKGRGGGELALFSVVPSIFFCFWLILLYKNNAANPVVLRFSYQCLAIAGAALSYYFSAGFVFRKAVTGRMVFSYLVTIFFCAVVLADAVSLPVKIIFALTLVNAFVNAVVFLRNLRSKTEEEEAHPPAQ